MSRQSELDRIILQLLGKMEHVHSKHSVIIYDQEEVVKLDLSHLELQEIPDGFFENFTELKELNLSHNSFNKLPEHLLRALTELRILDLSFAINPTIYTARESVSLPSNLLKSQSKLNSLNLSGNQLERLPDDFFANLYSLEVLDLSYNLLGTLPASLGQLTQLQRLYLESNFLPIEFANEYLDYRTTQEFLRPFEQKWASTHEPGSTDADKGVPSKDFMEDELKKAFSMLEDLF